MLQLEEFAEKNKTNFVRNVRQRLQHLFPNVYKGKDGKQKLLRDVRFLKVSCDGKIPPVFENDRENLRKLIQKGKDKVSDDIGINSESGNFLKSDVGLDISDKFELSSSLANQTTYARTHAHKPSASVNTMAVTPFGSYNNTNLHPQELQFLNISTTPTLTHPQNLFFPYDPNNLMQTNMPVFPHQYPRYSHQIYPSHNQLATHDIEGYGSYIQTQNAAGQFASDEAADMIGTSTISVNPKNVQQDVANPRISLNDLANIALQEHE